jgi:hypothetical protein
MGGIKFILPYNFQREWGRDWTHMCSFYFYEITWSVYLLLMLRSMHKNKELFVLLRCEDLNFKLQSPESPPPCGHIFKPKG